MHDFLAQRYAESEAIMAADKSISEDEKNGKFHVFHVVFVVFFLFCFVVLLSLKIKAFF
jgi:hypothetical protein